MSDTNMNYGLWVIVMCHKCTSLWAVLIMGETMHVWGKGHVGNVFVFCSI